MHATLNGRPKKQLSDQIDRLDRILDSLADGFKEIVAQAAEDGARLAAAKSIQELFSHPTMQELLIKAAAHPVVAEPSKAPALFEGLRHSLRQLRAALATITAPFARLMAPQKQRVQQAWQSVAFGFQLAWACRWGAVTALVIGTAAGLLGYFGPPSLAATLGSMCSASLTLASYTLAPILTALRRPAIS